MPLTRYDNTVRALIISLRISSFFVFDLPCPLIQQSKELLPFGIFNIVEPVFVTTLMEKLDGLNLAVGFHH